VGDFNGDRRQDLAIANSSGFGLLGSISIMLGKVDGTFQVASVLARRPGPMTVGDFNGDGRQDLATANGGLNTVSILLSRGDGSFQAARDVAVAQGPRVVQVGDFNGDGHQDLAAGNTWCDQYGFCQSNTVSILLGKGDGTLEPARDLPGGHGFGSINVADFNADGHQDLAAGLSIFLGRGDGTFESAKEFGVNGDFSSVAVGDFNKDGLPDLVTNTVSILINSSALKVDIDILPGYSPNQINPNSGGTIPVAIRTTHLFDAKLVDPATVRFGANGTEAPPIRFELRDVDGDFDMDMLLLFQIQKTGIRCGYTSATLRGKTVTGEPIRGSDSIQTVGCLQIGP
jgi:VCBS repeat protein